MAPNKLVTETHILQYPKGLVTPEDLVNFFEFPAFKKEWKRLGLDVVDLQALEVAIMLAPKRSHAIPGTGGLRKIRFSPKHWHMGKRGGLRIGYAYFEDQSIVLLVTAYSKREKSDLSDAEKHEIKELLRLVRLKT